MKRFYCLFLLLLPLSVFAQESFYYYKGEKQYLKLNTDYVFVSTVNENALQESNLLSGSIKVTKEQMSNLLKQKLNLSADFIGQKSN